MALRRLSDLLGARAMEEPQGGAERRALHSFGRRAVEKDGASCDVRLDWSGVPLSSFPNRGTCARPMACCEAWAVAQPTSQPEAKRVGGVGDAFKINGGVRLAMDAVAVRAVTRRVRGSEDNERKSSMRAAGNLRPQSMCGAEGNGRRWWMKEDSGKKKMHHDDHEETKRSNGPEKGQSQQGKERDTTLREARATGHVIRRSQAYCKSWQ